jgi:archaeosortase C (PEF-CTERM variant)
MALSLAAIANTINSLLPVGTSRRKVIQIVAIVLAVEGFSVILLFSYVGLGLGLVSLLAGIVILTILRPSREAARTETKSPGISLVESLVRLLGGEYVVMLIGALLVTAVILYNRFASARPDIGDVDTICILFGVILLVYPLLYDRYREEMSFSSIFVGALVLFLALPQVLQLFSGESGESTIGNWYVHYMLAAPFAGILDLVGVPTSSVGSMVTIQLQDGTIHTLSISAYCAGLYSFSIFLAAFISFVLVFESLTRRMLVLVLCLGLLAAYVGNILRMVMIGVIGYYEGIDALLWAHRNIGWMIFLSWSSVFWYAIFRYSSRHSHVKDESLGDC